METRKSIDKTSVWNKISTKSSEDLTKALNAERIAKRVISGGANLSYSYAAMDIDDETISMLGQAAKELGIIEQYKEVATGKVMNIGEKRMVLHHALRGTPFGNFTVDGTDYRAFYESERKRIADFAEKVRSGELKGSTGKQFTDIVQIGIGGSDLGPRALYLALEQWANTNNRLKLKASFISNVDPDDANAVLSRINPETSLFVLVSKSGTTQETLANEALVLAKLATVPGIDSSKHMVAVTSKTSPLANNPKYLDSFYIDDYIGGRYSATSGVGGVILSVSLGSDTFNELLLGAMDADKKATNADIYQNAALMDAMLGLFERDVLDRPTTAILPYTQALSRFPAHLQQLDMESNGKQIDREGNKVTLKTGPVIFGEPGTNGQHSFYQHLHQGTDVVPIQFIGFLKNQTGFDPAFQGSTARRKLNANLASQITAFATGKSDTNPNKNFPGNRPSSLIFGDELNPKALGALLSHYENKVMFQGFAWNINSFDQEGVQLGKKLTGTVLSENGPDNPVLAAYAKLLGAL